MAINVAWRNLIRQKTRLAISVGGVALAVLLILVLRGLYSGITTQATKYIRSVRADVWLAQAGTPGDFFHSVSLVPADAEQRVRAISGVRDVSPLMSVPVVLKVRGKDADLRLMGIDPARDVGGPPAIVEGRGVRGPGELAVDKVFARNKGIRVGDVVAVGPASLRVVGIATGGNAVISQFGWASLADVGRLLGAPGVVNYLVVRTSAERPADVGARITAQVPSLRSFTERQFEDKNTADLRESFLPIIWVLVVIALAIGVAVIGLTIYTATLEKSREYGVLKAIGFSNRRLYAIVFQQSAIAAVAGFVVGTGLSLALGRILERLLPAFVTSIRAPDVALAGVAAVLMALTSAFVPVRPVAKLDPAQVFRV